MSVHEQNDDIDSLLKRFAEGRSTPEEYDRVIRWFEGLDSKEKLTLDKGIQSKIKERLWANLENRILQKRLPSGQRKMSFIPAIAIAASLVLITLLFVYYYGKQVTTAPAQETAHDRTFLHKEDNTSDRSKLITLSDSTRVILSPGSYITFNDVAHEATRKVNLYGEAFFDVRPDKKRPFLVYTYEVITTVVGTSFNIKAPSSTDSVVVAVSTGRVVVSSGAGKENSNGSADQEVVILPNQQAVFNYESKKLTTSLVPDPVVLTNTVKNKMVYDEAPVTTILQGLEKTYGVDIVCDELMLSPCRVTTAFTDETLFKRLDILSTAIGATYRVEGVRIVIDGNGCN